MRDSYLLARENAKGFCRTEPGLYGALNGLGGYGACKPWGGTVR